MDLQNINIQHNDVNKKSIQEEIKKIIVELFSEISKMHGLSKSVGEVYGCVYLAQNPLCIDDIMKELGISRGNVSMNLNKLKEAMFIKKVWIKGERKQYYVHLNGFSLILDIINKEHTLFSNARDKLNEIDKKLNGKNEFIKHKLQDFEHMEKLLKETVDVIEKMNKNINYKI